MIPQVMTNMKNNNQNTNDNNYDNNIKRKEELGEKECHYHHKSNYNDVSIMLNACQSGDINLVKSLLSQNANCDDDGIIVNAKSNNESDVNNTSGSGDITHSIHLLSSLQDHKTGRSPLMAAAENGHLEICHLLLDYGAPWNAVDRQGKCAGNYATDNQHWDVVNLLVDAGTKAELILSASIRLSMLTKGNDEDTMKIVNECGTKADKGIVSSSKTEDTNEKIVTTNDSIAADQSKYGPSHKPVEFEPCTKPDYLKRNVQYNDENTLLLDDDNDAVMMEWERPLMDLHAQIITNDGQSQKIVLNVGFGLGIIDNALQKYNPKLHVIIEAHPKVYRKMINDGWDKKPNVRICFGKWQDELPKLIHDEKIIFDGIFFDTYGEHFTDLEDFHSLLPGMLNTDGGIYSFFNGLAPDNLFFHGVACQCVKLQLAQLGLQSEFARKCSL